MQISLISVATDNRKHLKMYFSQNKKEISASVHCTHLFLGGKCDSTDEDVSAVTNM